MNGNAKCPCGSGLKYKRCCRNKGREPETCRALRDILLDSSEGELRQALADSGQDFDLLAARGRAAARRALAKETQRKPR
jgi:hypothetical protein